MMQILKFLRHPIIWVSEQTIKLAIKALFFNKIDNESFKKLISNILDLLPHETLINTLKLLFTTFQLKPQEMYNQNILNKVIVHSVFTEQREGILGRIKYYFFYNYR